ncbi:hypothetical protein HMPREF0291_10710 [Corynebacterium genitalium ATCC 33030]|uniref:Uncharacterized protein n=1 Tax=Corynebacterium genitalium ATCC 33030 TaxID=585529 RepID=D7W9H2_9CORY|nr:hypothetical protein HMPREF0291_10710 [Corynebacterium genitalium ATCC 33030]
MDENLLGMWLHAPDDSPRSCRKRENNFDCNQRALSLPGSTASRLAQTSPTKIGKVVEIVKIVRSCKKRP